MARDEDDGLVNFINALFAMLFHAYPDTVRAFIEDRSKDFDERSEVMGEYLRDLYGLTLACGDEVEIADTTGMNPADVTEMYWDVLGDYVIAFHLLLDNLYNRLDRRRAVDELNSIRCDALRDYVSQEVRI